MSDEDEAEIELSPNDDGGIGPIERTLQLAAEFIKHEGPPSAGDVYLCEATRTATPFDDHLSPAVRAARDDALVAAYDVLTWAFRAISSEGQS